MLKARIKTAALLLPLVIGSILFLNPLPFMIISLLFFLLALWEWTSLAGFTSTLSRIGAFLLIPLVVLLSLAILQLLGKNVLQEGVPVLIIAFWFLVFFLLIRYPKNLSLWKSKATGIMAGGIALIPAWAALVLLHHLDPKWVLYVLTLIWAVDTAAYFVGKRFGKHKLAPHVSPGKTWEGVGGAFIAALLVATLGYFILEPRISWLGWMVLALITTIFAIVGDLFESAFKRAHHLKDSGSLLPGHGGILDRIDSILAAVPLFTLNFMFFT